MERIQSVNLDRIEWACAEYGITLEQLAPTKLQPAPRCLTTAHELGGAEQPPAGESCAEKSQAAQRIDAGQDDYEQ